MSSSAQQELLALLADVCESSPEVRMGQLLAQIAFLAEDATGCAFAEIDDAQLLNVIRQHATDLASRAVAAG